MKHILTTRHGVRAFTLIELLVVVAIIGILASLLLSALIEAKINTQKNLARTDEANLVASIQQYYAQYSRLPASTNAVTAASSVPANGGSSNDFTYGATFASAANGSITIQTVGASSSYTANNSEVIAILRDDVNIPVEANHVYNPQQSQFFNAKMAVGPNSPGIDVNDVFRDPWGNPYIITLDLNCDGKCFDANLNSMYQANSAPLPGPLLISGEAVVWSLGPYYQMLSVNPQTGLLGGPLATGVNHRTIVTTSF